MTAPKAPVDLDAVVDDPKGYAARLDATFERLVHGEPEAPEPAPAGVVEALAELEALPTVAERVARLGQLLAANAPPRGPSKAPVPLTPLRDRVFAMRNATDDLEHAIDDRQFAAARAYLRAIKAEGRALDAMLALAEEASTA